MMAHGQTNRLSSFQGGPNSQPGLPPGVRQADCDGLHDPFADASGNQLWNACNLVQQESLSSRFVARHGDLVRDALLDVQDSPNPSPSPKLRLGSLLWPTWICFRDRNLREMLQRGELRGT
ncbi:MAG: hypothetical protein ABSB42_21980 [Tepidisphaeraceae bacterium]|jgi:hypothetical protein